MTKHTDPKPYIEINDTEGNQFKIVSPDGAIDDTEGNGASGRFVAPDADGETDDTEGNGSGCRF